MYPQKQFCLGSLKISLSLYPKIYMACKASVQENWPATVIICEDRVSHLSIIRLYYFNGIFKHGVLYLHVELSMSPIYHHLEANICS